MKRFLKVFGITFAILVVLIIICMPSEEERAQREAESEAEAAAKAAEEVEEKRKGFHCLSAWDASHDGVVQLVRDRMNDPDSFDHIETLIAPVNENGKHALSMEFTGNNAFGGRVRQKAVAIVDNETCNAALVGIE